MLGLLDRFHAFVVLQRFPYRCRSRGTDVVAAETARIAMNANRKMQRIALDRMCAGERGKEKKKNSGGGRRRERSFECLAYLIDSKLLLCFTASASAVAPGSPMLLRKRLHGWQ